MKRISMLMALIFLARAVSAQETAESVNRLGLEEFNKGNYPAAAEHFERAVRLKPKFAPAYFNLGTAQFHLRRFDASVQSLQRAIKLGPSTARYNQLGVVYVEAGEGVRAIAAFKDAIRIEPDHALALYNLGCAYIRLDDFKGSIGPLEQARQLDPGNAEIRLNLAYALSRDNRVVDAIKEMELAVDLEPADAGLRLFLGTLFVLAKDPASAGVQYAKLKQIDTQLARHLFKAIRSGRIISISDLDPRISNRRTPTLGSPILR